MGVHFTEFDMLSLPEFPVELCGYIANSGSEIVNETFVVLESPVLSEIAFEYHGDVVFEFVNNGSVAGLDIV